MEEGLKIVKIRNPLDRKKREVEVVPYTNQSLLEIRQKYFPIDIDVMVSVNGRIISTEEQALYFPNRYEEVVFIPPLEAEIAALVIAVISTYIAPTLASYAFGVAITELAAWQIALVGGALMIAGGLIVNALMPPASNNMGSEADASTAYSWSPNTAQKQGGVVPRYYGRNKVYGNVIESWIDTDVTNNVQYLNTLFALSSGPVSGLYYWGDYVSIKLNDKYIDDYEDISWYFNKGEVNQVALTGFNKVVKDIVKNDHLIGNTDDDWTTYETMVNDAFDEIELEFTYPKGLYYMKKKSGDLISNSITLEIQYARQPSEGALTWTSLANLTLSGETMKRLYKTQSIPDLLGGKYFVRFRRTREELYSDAGVEVPDTYKQYWGDEVYCTAFRLIDSTAVLTYPRTSMIGVRAKATDQISGSINFEVILDGALVRVYDGASWNIEWSRNPAWICYDILTQPVITGTTGAYTVDRYEGIPIARLDTDSFKTWADWCDDEVLTDVYGVKHERCTFNGGFDTEQSMWEAALQVCRVGGAVLVWNGTNLSVVVDKPSEPVQLFSMGNILKGSFEETFLSYEDRANTVEVDFVNGDNEYQRDVLTFVNPSITTTAQKASIQLFGITNTREATRMAKQQLLFNQYFIRVISFQADIDAIACVVGDVITFQHDVPEWGYGGRVVSATSNTVTVDCDLGTLEGGHVYEIIVRLSSTDTLVTKTVVSVTTTNNQSTVTISGTWTTNPEQYDVFAFGEVQFSTKEYRVTGIERSGDQKAKITAAQYDDRMYNADNLGAGFTGTPRTSTTAPLTVTFTDASIGLSIDYWEWDFGDGTKSYDQNPTHTYTTTGTFDVTLTVKDDGCTDYMTWRGYIVIGSGSGGGGGSTPSDISGCKLWLDGKTSTIVESGGKVDSWSDLSGNNNHAIKYSDATRPIKSTSGGYTSIYFDGGDYLDLTKNESDSALRDATNGMTVVIVYSCDNATTQMGLMGAGTSTYHWEVSNHKAVTYNSSGTGYHGSGERASYPISTDRCIQTVSYYPGASGYLKVYRNGSLISSNQHGCTIRTEVDGAVRVGINGTSGNPLTGHIQAVAVYNRALTAAEIIQVETYFSTEYGVSDYSNWDPTEIANVISWYNAYASKKVHASTSSDDITGVYNLVTGGYALTCSDSGRYPDFPTDPAVNLRKAGYLRLQYGISSTEYLKTPDCLGTYTLPITVFAIVAANHKDFDTGLLWKDYVDVDCPVYRWASNDRWCIGADQSYSTYDNTNFHFIMAYVPASGSAGVIKVDSTSTTGSDTGLTSAINFFGVGVNTHLVDLIIVKGDARASETAVRAYYDKVLGGATFPI